MLRAIKLTVYRLAKCLGLFAVSRHLTRRGLRILCYHGIWLGEGHYGNFLFMSKSKFDRRMELLAAGPYKVMSLQGAFERSKTAGWPDLATMITIDDGWYGTYHHMLPTLERLRLPATIYVSTYYVRHQWPVFNVLIRFMVERTVVRRINLGEIGIAGHRNYDLDDDRQREAACHEIITHTLEKSEHQQRDAFCRDVGRMLGVDYDDIVAKRVFHLMSVGELQRATEQGFDIQLHTHRHRFPIDDEDGIVREIEDNRRALETVVQKPLEHLCYPSGRYHPRVWDTLKSLNIVSATTSRRGLNFASTPPLDLFRLLDGEELTQLEFEAELSGFAHLARRSVRWLTGAQPSE
jgi:peptidoglycan/xylan/chitin deacetylase (PgdA/CDA1 family)